FKWRKLELQHLKVARKHRCSPLLWCFVVEGTIIKLNESGVRTISHVDDRAIVVEEKDAHQRSVQSNSIGFSGCSLIDFLLRIFTQTETSCTAYRWRLNDPNIFEVYGTLEGLCRSGDRCKAGNGKRLMTRKLSFEEPCRVNIEGRLRW